MNDNVFACFREKDLHEHFLDLIKPNGRLNELIQNTSDKDSIEFKRGVSWGIAMFLISVTANCEKVYVQEADNIDKWINEAQTELAEIEAKMGKEGKE